MAEQRNTLSKKLTAYSAAAAAALMMAPSADAAVVYSGLQNLPVNLVTAPVLVDLDNGGYPDIAFYANSGFSSAVHYNAQRFMISGHFIYSTGYGSFPLPGGHGTFPPNLFPANLPAGFVISSALSAPYAWHSVVNPYGFLTISFSSSSTHVGEFRNTDGYLGVMFVSNAACRYPTFGWIQYRDDGAAQGTIIDWAYDDGCAPIAAGAGSLTNVPTMGEWGLLALAGLLSAAAISAINKEKEETA